MRLRLSNLIPALQTPLLIAGAVGFFVYVVLFPRIHPDAAIQPSMTSDEVRRTADAYLESIGLDGRQFDATISLRRSQELLNHLQAEFGLPATRRYLQANAIGPLPVYYHRVIYLERGEASTDISRWAKVDLLTDGRIVAVETPGVTERTRDVQALESIGWGATGPDDGATSSLDIAEDDIRTFERLAMYHLSRSAWSELAVSVDSVWTIDGDTGPGARIIFRSDTLVTGSAPQIRLEVGTSGELREMRVLGFRPDEEESRGGVSISFGDSDEGPLAVVKFIAHIALFILLLVLFFRRLDARLVDLRGAFRDSFFGGILGLISALLLIGYNVGVEAGFGGIPLLVGLVISLLVAAMTLAVTFVASAVGDSYARETWPESIRPLDLVRQLSIINQPIGLSLIHGIAAAGVMIAIGVLVLYLPGASIGLGSDFPAASSWRPVLSSFTDQGWLALYLVLAIAAGVGGWLKRDYPRLAVVASIVLFGMVDVSTVPIGTIWLSALASLAAGIVLMWSFVRHGVVSAIVAFVVARTAVSLAPGWFAAPVPETLDFILAVIVFAALLVIGLVGAASPRRIEQTTIYIPPYVIEHSEQQRIERELEIARNVQTSFLPQTLPHMAGVDTAAICVPAHEVGGDYYDAVKLDEHRLAIIIGDVSGKGIKAAFYMTLVKGVIQSLAQAGRPPRDVLNHLNEIFFRNAPRGTFVSLIYGVFDTRTGRFSYARAGHNPLLVTQRGEALFEQPAGIAIGLTSADRFYGSLSEHTVVVEQDEVLLLYTDGVSEAMNIRREQFGEERIANLMLNLSRRPASDIVDDLRREIDSFTGEAPQNDDMTLIVLRRVSEREVPVDQT